MLQRLKYFVKSFYGESALTAFGFDVPLPSTRPKLKGVAGDKGGEGTALPMDMAVGS